MTLRSLGLASLLALPFSLALTPEAAASERHFTYTYESNVLNPGDVEIEPWTTWRAGRKDYYSRFDQRLEFEFGVVPNLQMAWYWNMTALAADQTDATTGQTTRATGFEFGGVSNEWKYKLSDSLADPLGSALYFEWTAAPAEAELEAKVILDKRMGNALVAFNAVAEHEWEFESKGETEREVVLEADLAFGYFLTPSLVLGVELRSHTELENGDEHLATAFFAGPSLAYAQKAWWMALTVQPQLFAIQGDDESKASHDTFDLAHHERLNARILFGMDL